MPKLTIDGRTIEVPAGMTILDAAKMVGVDIPTMCFLEGHPAETSCMICVVKVNGSARLVPACATRAQDGMVVESSSQEVTDARRTALELLLGDHVGDCVGPCRSTCPAHMDIPAMIRRISQGRFRDALVTVKRHIALPASLGRVCPEVCEKGCRRAVHDSAVSICLLKRFVADTDLASLHPYVPEKRSPTGKKVAIVGAGPAGLAAAYYLLQDGHECVVFDAQPLPGGMLRYGPASERLPHEVLDAEVSIIRQLGADFRQSATIESPEDIRAEFDAVLLAVGRLEGDFAVRWGLRTTAHGLNVDRTTMLTSVPGVFAAGSAITPSKLAVRAVGDGRSAALAISRYLAGKPLEAAHDHYSVHIGRLVEDEISVFMAGASESGRVEAPKLGFSEDDAKREAARCMHCECGKLGGCKLRNYGMEYKANPSKFKGKRGQVTRATDHPFVIYEPGKCISCGLCVSLAEQAGEPLGLAFIGRGFNVRPGIPFDEPFSKALCKVAEQCAEACPTGALVIRKDPS
jgi:NADPH-dependent glutamate synthase beta subunit-like oxidoreductase/ferredoxin